MSGFALHIVGAGRGGTSLISCVIDAHQDCEIHLEQYSQSILIPDGDVGDRIARFLTACNSHAALFPGKLWGHKTTTEHIETLGALDQFVTATYHIPTIFVLRDGRSCVCSKVNRTGQSFETAVHRWKYSVAVLDAYRAANGPLLVVKFEDVVMQPEKSMRRVCAFLKIEYQPEMLQGTSSSKMLGEYRSATFDRTKIATEGLSDEWTSQMLPELVANGYVV